MAGIETVTIIYNLLIFVYKYMLIVSFNADTNAE